MVLERSAAIDGRTQRRETNRTAVVDALLTLYGEGVLAPSTDEIARRAGISPRSLFRYFEDVDDLVRASIERQQERLEPLWELTVDAEAPLGERIDRFVAGRVRLLESMGEVGRVARGRAPRNAVVATELARVRSALRGQLAMLFSTELEARGPDSAAVLASLDVLTSWESYDLLRHDQGLSRQAATQALALGIGALLGVAS